MLRRQSWGFAIGSSLFAVGAVPFSARVVGVAGADVLFFVGALFFTAAAFLQLTSSRGPDRGGQKTRADVIDRRASAVQVAGTLFFNVSTTVALLTALHPSSDGGSGWRPDAFGSVCFLVAGALGVVASRQRRPRSGPVTRAGWSAWLNLLGSVFFGLSAVGAYVIPATADPVSVFWDDLGTFLGALCFLAAALFGLPARRG